MPLRKLTDTEIKSIFENFTFFFPNYLDDRLLKSSILQIKQKLMKDLSHVKVDDQKIPLLKQKLEDYTLKSVIPAGECVGVITAQSLGEKQTQLTLNSFHQAGLSLTTVVTGVPRFVEVMNTTKEPKNANNNFFLKNKNLSLQSIKRVLSQNLKCIKFKDLINSYEISIGESNLFWYDAFFQFYPPKDRFSKFVCIAYHLNKEFLFREQICFLNLKKKIETEFEDLVVLFSPVHIAQVHILIDYEKIDYKDDQIIKDEYFQKHLVSFIEIFYEDQLKNRIEDVMISGVPKIKDFFFDRQANGEYMIHTNGSNLKELLKLNFIDKTTIKSNDLWDIYHLVGIEGVRKFLIEELTQIVSSDGGFINNCHISLLVDTMTVTGNITSISRYGIKKEKASVLARSSFEESLDHFVKAGFYAEKENVKSVSASIMCGKHCNIGSGLVDIIPNWSFYNSSSQMSS